MRYSYEFKRKCVEMYRKGIWMETPEGITQKNFRITIRRWCQIEDVHGIDGLRHCNFNKVWTPEQKLEFVESTVDVDFSTTQNKFIQKLDGRAHILDFGCGSGRDTKYFLDKGFNVTAIDGSVELCKFASQFTGIEVKHMYFQELEDVEVYDGIWACSSILHLSYDELKEVLNKMIMVVKDNGIIYTSFKYGTFEGVRNGRYFTDLNEVGLEQLLQSIPGVKLEELWVTGDVRPGRGEERWLNLILRKV